MRQMNSWVLLLSSFSVIYWSLGGILFRYTVEE